MRTTPASLSLPLTRLIAPILSNRPFYEQILVHINAADAHLAHKYADAKIDTPSDEAQSKNGHIIPDTGGLPAHYYTTSEHSNSKAAFAQAQDE